MLSAFLALTAVVAVVYLGYPTAILLIAVLRPLRISPCRFEGGQPWPTVTVVVPAHDEQAIIEAKLRNFLDLDYEPALLRAAVISDGSTDGTCERVREFLAAASPADRARIALIERRQRSGKSRALSEEVPKLDGEIVVFTDANAFYRPDAIRSLVAPFADPRVGLACGRLRYIPDDASFMSDEELYWRYEDLIKEAEGRAGKLLVANGSIYAIRAELFRPIPGEVADDFALPLLVAAAGRSLVYIPDAIAEERLPAQGIENFRAKARIVTRGATALRLYWGEVLRSGPLRVFQYALHKIARWLMGLVLAALFVVSAAGAPHPLLAAAFTGQVTFYLLGVAAYLLARRGPVPGLLRMPFYFLLVNAAALVGLLEFLRGHRRITWEKSETTRRSPTEEVAVATAHGDLRTGRPWSGRTALLVALVLVSAAALGAETGLRLTYFIRDTVRDWRGAVPPKPTLNTWEVPDLAHPGNWRLRAGAAVRLRDLPAPAGVEGPVARRARELGVAGDEVLFSVNADGYKGPPLLRDAGVPRILALGDSCTFGSVLDRYSYPRVVDRELGRYGLPVEVVNGGVSGYYPVHVLARIDEFRALNPEYTLICVGSNALYGQRYTPTRWVDRLYGFRVLDALAARWKATRGASNTLEPRVDPDDPEIHRFGTYDPSFIGDIGKIGTEMAEAGSRVFVLTLPSLYVSGERPSADALSIGVLPRFTDNPYALAALLSRYNQLLRELADRHGFALIDVASWSREALRPRHEYFASAVVLNEKGQERMGVRIAERLKRELEPGLP
jgi:cellulose synthase/poly-beta-1,6-N-acetylglucosamine synthase-like glycosyltransferase/lysophospholipase L1-like esterase